MAQALVIYESMFGNTRAVARAVAEGLAPRMPVEVVPVSQAPAEVGPGVELLVVAGPTHSFGLSRASTRRSAVDQGGRPEGGTHTGIREWLDGLQRVQGPRRAVTLDTRVRVRGIPGSAARGAARRLRSLGYDVVQSRTFWVTGTPGPLADGELERARSWGRELAQHRPGRAEASVG
jgi:hypothetical protein